MNMDFVVDKQTKTVSITKEFAFELSLVWDAYTKPELLDQWWAPKPLASRTKVMDFRVGGATILCNGKPGWPRAGLGNSEIYFHQSKDQFQVL